ncbi:MAG TPA: polysaccharide deacetylase family protein [Bacilli bacterium]|nr:polysaccharide deacetylase family protein [Bacilli bacterium]
MLQVIVPPGFLPEKKYILHTLLHEFLGLTYTLSEGVGDEYLIWLDNGNLLTFQDHFFSRCNEEFGYLKKHLLPERVVRTKVPFLSGEEEDLPILYGTDACEIGPGRIECGCDLFASAFFFLTRWEEIVKKERDWHERFPARYSLAMEHDLLRRPVVNEYVEWLWNLLQALGIEQARKERPFRFFLTHDVDFLYQWRSKKNMLRTLGGDLLKRRDAKQAFSTCGKIAGVARGTRKDPYDTFDWLMELSESRNIRSRFYWMSGGVTKHDRHFEITEPRARELLEEMERRGHVVGFHPSYATFDDAKQFGLEKEALERELGGATVTEGRQHYLRFSVPGTWQIWEDAGLSCDSSLGYAEAPGFRAGVCYEYPVFNVETREMLQVRERPLIAMELSYLDPQYLGWSEERVLHDVLKLAETCRRYGGDFVLLWHNSSLDTPEKQDLYRRLVITIARWTEEYELRKVREWAR